jgi:adenosylmethionine-8-amino-7-oxononanoate aminotransferase
MAPGLVDGAAAPASLPIAAGMAAAPVAAPTKSSSHVMHRHLGVMPLKAIRAEGCYIYGENRRFLDACGGAAVVSVGHGDKRMIAALTEQLNSVNYVHSGNWATDCSEELAEVLCADANERGGDFARAYFALGGSEAVESAVKLARQHFVEKGELQRTNFIGRDQGACGTHTAAL